MAIPQAAKRISKLPLLDGDEILKIQESALKGTDPDGSTYTHSDAWGIGVDSLCRNDGTAIGPGGLIPGMHVDVDDGTAFIPMSRIAMRDTNGKIPASMLPGHIDDMIFGTLDDTDQSVTKFREPPPSGATTGHVYSSPTQGTGELPPPENVIFCDTTTSIQYRYIQSQAQTYNDTVKHGFTEVPGTRTVNPGYGIEITKASDANLTVKARKPRQFVGKGNSSNRMYIGASPSGLETLTETPYMALHITDDVDHRKFNVSGLVDDGDVIDPYETVAYHVDMELACWPYIKTANIITLNVIDLSTALVNPVVMSSADYDMSSLATLSTPDTIVFSFDFVTQVDTKTFQVEIANGDGSDNPVYAYVKRISISELL